MTPNGDTTMLAVAIILLVTTHLAAALAAYGYGWRRADQYIARNLRKHVGPSTAGYEHR